MTIKRISSKTYFIMDANREWLAFLFITAIQSVFYKQYREEIDNLLYEEMEGCGFDSPTDLFGSKWDKEDPLGRDCYNQNLLAWFGFEETLRKLGYEFEKLQDAI